MPKLLLPFLLLLFLAACEEPQKPHLPPLPDSAQQAHNDSVKKNAPEDTAAGLLPPDSIHLLSLSGFHHEEVWPEAVSEKWQGIFRHDSTCYVDDVQLRFRRCYDPVVDDDSTVKSGWNVTTTHKDSCLFLCSGAGFGNGNVNSIRLSKQEILPGESETFQYNGTTYTLFATGKSAEEFYADYKLYLKAEKDGQVIKQLLIKQENFDEQMIKLLFIGDLDGDTRPDFLIDASRHYNMLLPTLFLSGKAEKSKLLKKMAQHRQVGC